MFNDPRTRKVRADVASALRVTKGEKTPTINEHDYQGLAAFDASLYEHQHRHGSRKHVLQSLNKPVVTVTTQKESQYVPNAIVQGIELSPEQLAHYARTNPTPNLEK